MTHAASTLSPALSPGAELAQRMYRIGQAAHDLTTHVRALLDSSEYRALQGSYLQVQVGEIILGSGFALDRAEGMLRNDSLLQSLRLEGLGRFGVRCGNCGALVGATKCECGEVTLSRAAIEKLADDLRLMADSDEFTLRRSAPPQPTDDDVRLAEAADALLALVAKARVA